MTAASRTIPAGREVEPQPLSVGTWFEDSPYRVPISVLAPVIDRLIALPTLAALYARLPDDERAFWDRALEALEIAVDVPAENIRRIPRDGPLVVVANHPFGCADGLALMSIVARRRRDVRLLGNAVLSRIPELRRSSFLVDVFGGASAVVRNAAPMRDALKWLERGGALAMFPAGEVAHLRSHDAIVDAHWSPSVSRLIARANAHVVPVFFHGRNSALFYAAGRVHPRLRTLLLVRELLGQRGRTIRAEIGDRIAPGELASAGTAQARTAELRRRTYALGDVRRSPQTATCDVLSRVTPVADAESASVMASEIAALPESQVLLRSGSFAVCLATAAEIPRTLQEIGRQRELAFRAVGEGSGRARDLDRFDFHYKHLVVWSQERSEIVGSYRLAQTDEVVPRLGVAGLYTNTLFRYDERVLADLGPALELGRAFVRREYQRDYSPLLLLWKGIGAYVARHPRYRSLFGTVSISSNYQSLSQQIMASFLYATSFRADVASRIQPRNPPAFLRSGRGVPSPFTSVARTITDVGALLAEIESDGKGVPVLLRQYLKLNARLLGFNVDPAFGDVLDGLMMVDLLDIDRQLLTRYLGKAGAIDFLNHHDPTAGRQAS